MPYPFDADEMVRIYRKRFGVEPPYRAVDSMVHWDLPNDLRAETLYNINTLVRMLMDQLKDSSERPSHPQATDSTEPIPQLQDV